jgi:hypothetical protein
MLVTTVIATLIAALIITRRVEISANQVEVQPLPNQTIHCAALHAALVCFLGGSMGGLAVWLVIGFIAGVIMSWGGKNVIWVIGGPVVWFVCVVGVGLVCGLQSGGLACLQHYLLRLLLIRNRSMPRQLLPFLDHAARLSFLRRVGGGYMFAHRMLLEHFADQYSASATASSSTHTPSAPSRSESSVQQTVSTAGGD